MLFSLVTSLGAKEGFPLPTSCCTWRLKTNHTETHTRQLHTDNKSKYAVNKIEQNDSLKWTLNSLGGFFWWHTVQTPMGRFFLDKPWHSFCDINSMSSFQELIKTPSRFTPNVFFSFDRRSACQLRLNQEDYISLFFFLWHLQQRSKYIEYPYLSTIKQSPLGQRVGKTWREYVGQRNEGQKKKEEERWETKQKWRLCEQSAHIRSTGGTEHGGEDTRACTAATCTHMQTYLTTPNRRKQLTGMVASICLAQATHTDTHTHQYAVIHCGFVLSWLHQQPSSNRHETEVIFQTRPQGTWFYS